jgi:hypothetical protein
VRLSAAAASDRSIRAAHGNGLVCWMSLAATTAIPAMATRSARRAHLSLLAAPVGRGWGASVAVSLPKGDGRWARERHGALLPPSPGSLCSFRLFPSITLSLLPPSTFSKVHKAYGYHRPYKAHADRGSDNRVRPLATHRIPQSRCRARPSCAPPFARRTAPGCSARPA